MHFLAFRLLWEASKNTPFKAAPTLGRLHRVSQENIVQQIPLYLPMKESLIRNLYKNNRNLNFIIRKKII